MIVPKLFATISPFHKSTALKRFLVSVFYYLGRIGRTIGRHVLINARDELAIKDRCYLKTANSLFPFSESLVSDCAKHAVFGLLKLGSQ